MDDDDAGRGAATSTAPAESKTAPTSGLVTLHDALVAWQRGRLTARQAMALTGTDTVADLYAAARSSAVPIRKTLLESEKAAANFATAAIRRRLSAGIPGGR